MIRKWKPTSMKRHKEWRGWFAWRPVIINDKIVWLEWIERSFELHYNSSYIPYWIWCYRFIEEET